MLFKMTYWIMRVVGALYRRAGMRIAGCLHRATLANVGTGTRFQVGVRFAQPGAVSIGRDCLISSRAQASGEEGQGVLEIGDRVQINCDVQLDITGGLRLADDVLISQGAVLYTHDHGFDPRSVPRPCAKSVGQGAWIGMQAIILPECQSIGVGAVIGAGAVVTRDVPAGAIVAGNPACIIRRRQLAEVVA